MKYLSLYVHKLDFQKQRFFLVKSLWKKKYKTKFIYLLSKKKKNTIFGKPIFLEDVQSNNFDKFGYPCSQNVFTLRALTGLPLLKLTSHYKCFNSNETLKHINIFSKYNFEYNMFKIKNYNFFNSFYFFNYFFNSQKQKALQIFNNIFVKKVTNACFIKNKLNFNSYIYQNYSNNILSSFKFWLNCGLKFYNKSYLNLFYVKGIDQTKVELYLKLKFFYLYIFKNVELKYIHLILLKVIKFKKIFKIKKFFVKYSLSFFNFLLQKIAISVFFQKIKYFYFFEKLLIKKPHVQFFYNYYFFNKNKKNLMPGSKLFFYFTFSTFLKKKINNITSFAIKRKQITNQFISTSIKSIFFNKKNLIFNFKLNIFFIKVFNKNYFYFFYRNLLKFFKISKDFLFKSFIQLFNYTKQVNILTCLTNLKVKVKQVNIYVFNRYLNINKSVTINNNNICLKFFKKLFFKHNRKFFKKFWKYSLITNLKKIRKKKRTYISFFSRTNLLKYNISKFNNLVSFNFLFLQLKTKKLKFKKIMALTFFLSFLLNRNHWYYYYNLFMPNVKLNVLTTNNENLIGNIKLLSWFKKNKNNKIYKQKLFLSFFKNKNLYSFFYQYLFYKQLYGVRNFNILNLFYITNYNFFFNTYNYVYYDNFLGMEMRNFIYFDNTNICDVNIKASRLFYYKQIFNYNALNNNLISKNFNYKYLHDFFFFNSNLVINFLNKRFVQMLNIVNLKKKKANICQLYFKNIILMNFYIYFFNIFSMMFKKITNLIFIYFNYFFSFVFIKKSITALDIKKKKIFFDMTVLIYFQYVSLLKFLVKLVKIYILLIK